MLDEIEEEIRSRNCIYVVKPSSKSITSTIETDVSQRGSNIQDKIHDLAKQAELDYLFELEGSAFNKEFDRLIKKYTPEHNKANGEISEFAVASQCLSGVQVGDAVTIVKFRDIVTISPPLGAGSYTKMTFSK